MLSNSKNRSAISLSSPAPVCEERKGTEESFKLGPVLRERLCFPPFPSSHRTGIDRPPIKPLAPTDAKKAPMGYNLLNESTGLTGL